jgi:NhaA family Na+:H+ antiporter
MGFTVSLLIGELAFTAPADAAHVKAAVLAGSLTAAALASVLLKRRDRIYRRLFEAENLDQDDDGIPDIYQRTPGSAA